MLIFVVTNTNTPTLWSTVSAGNGPFSTAWSPDGRFVALANYTDLTLQIYRFNGTTSPALISTTPIPGYSPRALSWSPDGRFLSVVNDNSFAPLQLLLFTFTGSEAPTLLGTMAAGDTPYSTAWSPDSQFVAVTNFYGNTLQIFKANYAAVAQPQAFSSSLIFGNSARGSNANVNVCLLGNACVSLNGKIQDESM
jgi:DNA-binding beta-propeller fold protein YncE